MDYNELEQLYIKASMGGGEPSYFIVSVDYFHHCPIQWIDDSIEDLDPDASR